MTPESVAVTGRYRCKNSYYLLKGEFARLCRPELITAILPGGQRAKSSPCSGSKSHPVSDSVPRLRIPSLSACNRVHVERNAIKSVPNIIKTAHKMMSSPTLSSPTSPNSTSSDSPSSASTMFTSARAPELSEILKSLYISDIFSASDEEILDTTGITHVVSVCQNIPWLGPPPGSSYRVLNINVDDSLDADLLAHFDASNAFIHEALANKQGGKVLCHCLAVSPVSTGHILSDSICAAIDK